MNAQPEWIDDLDGPFEEEAPEAAPTDDDVAIREWLNRRLRRIAFLTRERAVLRRVAANERARIEQWEERQVGQLDRAIAWQSRPVEDWARQELERNPKVKSFTLPAGTISTRTAAVTVDIYDEETLLRWAAEHQPGLVIVTTSERLDRTALRKVLRETGSPVDPTSGEVIPGVSVSPGVPSVTIHVEEEP